MSMQWTDIFALTAKAWAIEGLKGVGDNGPGTMQSQEMKPNFVQI